jgi:hypothetical protein
MICNIPYVRAAQVRLVRLYAGLRGSRQVVGSEAPASVQGEWWATGQSCSAASAPHRCRADRPLLARRLWSGVEFFQVIEKLSGYSSYVQALYAIGEGVSGVGWDVPSRRVCVGGEGLAPGGRKDK